MVLKKAKAEVKKNLMHLNAFNTHESLIQRLGIGNAHLVWAMSLYLDHPDPIELASEALTDHSNDKNIDFLKLDIDSKRIIVAQGYYAPSGKKSTNAAPSKKAESLGTAYAWLISGDVEDIPAHLRTIVSECRTAIANEEVDQIDLLFVHNLPESTNAAKELQTIATHIQKSLTGKIQVITKELGIETLERLYTTQESSIAINKTIKVPFGVKFKEMGPKWEAAVTSVSGEWLRKQFYEFGEDLFSANYRGFLGISKRKKINTVIRGTAESAPENFWVFNNGITILTRGLKGEEGGDSIEVDGMSIINGAQTTGSIGSVPEGFPLSSANVLCRIIKCSDSETVQNIVKFNNTQNVITTWDQYSNAPEQKRIQNEFETLGHTYSLKRGFSEATNLIGVEQVANSLISFSGDYASGNIGKNYIFETKSLYNKCFDSKKASHILFVYALSKSIDEIRLELKSKEKLINIEERQLKLLKYLRFKNFCIAIISKNLETILGFPVETSEVSFTTHASNVKNKSFYDLIASWLPIVRIVTTYLANKYHENFSDIIQRDDALNEVGIDLSTFIYTSFMSNPNPGVETFKLMVDPHK